MKQSFIILIVFVVATGFFCSCDDTKTYAEQLMDEKASIKAFIKDQGYIVVSAIPPDSVPWPDGVFYKTKSGLYIHVIDTGTCVIDTIPLNTVISVRFIEISMDGDSSLSNMNSASSPSEILYGNVDSGNWWDCKALHEPLDYVGDYGHVYIIAPAEIGMSYNTTSTALTANFYELRYTFWK